MFGVRILLFIVAFIVVVAETWAGIIATEPIQQIFAIVMGGFIIALLLSVSMFVLAGRGADGQESHGSPIQWATLLVAGLLISAVSFFLPTEILPMLTETKLVSINGA